MTVGELKEQLAQHDDQLEARVEIDADVSGEGYYDPVVERVDTGDGAYVVVACGDRQER